MIPQHNGPYFIPEISDSQLAERAAMVRIAVEREAYESIEGRPNAIRVRSLGLWWIEMPTDLRGVSVVWSPVWVRAVMPGEIVAAKKVLTLHGYSSRSLPVPSVAEVLAVAPDDLHEYVAFSIRGPQDADDLNANCEALRAGYHVAEVTYYRSGTPS